jgi:hypothetical protein
LFPHLSDRCRYLIHHLVQDLYSGELFSFSLDCNEQQQQQQQQKGPLKLSTNGVRDMLQGWDMQTRVQLRLAEQSVTHDTCALTNAHRNKLNVVLSHCDDEDHVYETQEHRHTQRFVYCLF